MSSSRIEVNQVDLARRRLGFFGGSPSDSPHLLLDLNAIHVPRFEICIQEFRVQLDEDFLLRSFEFFRSIIPKEDSSLP
jgi:hypothetical protein